MHTFLNFNSSTLTVNFFTYWGLKSQNAFFRLQRCLLSSTVYRKTSTVFFQIICELLTLILKKSHRISRKITNQLTLKRRKHNRRFSNIPIELDLFLICIFFLLNFTILTSFVPFRLNYMFEPDVQNLHYYWTVRILLCSVLESLTKRVAGRVLVVKRGRRLNRSMLLYESSM